MCLQTDSKQGVNVHCQSHEFSSEVGSIHLLSYMSNNMCYLYTDDTWLRSGG